MTVQNTVFTMNLSQVDSNLQALIDLGANPVQQFNAVYSDCGCGCGDICFAFGVNLPQAVQFQIPSHMSRSSLVNLFGSSAMVRGVSH